MNRLAISSFLALAICTTSYAGSDKAQDKLNLSNKESKLTCKVKGKKKSQSLKDKVESKALLSANFSKVAVTKPMDKKGNKVIDTKNAKVEPKVTKDNKEKVAELKAAKHGVKVKGDTSQETAKSKKQQKQADYC